MKPRAFAIFFLCLYSLVLFKPLFPLVDYLVNKDFIAKNLCENRFKPKMKCNGKCHLMKQIKKASADQNSPANSNPQKNAPQEESSSHIAGTLVFFARRNFIFEDQKINFGGDYVSCDFTKGIFHPPSLA